MRKGLAETLLEQGANVIGRAAGAIMSERRGQEALARAIGLAQRGLRAFESVQERALHAAGLAARPDYAELRKQVARLRRKTREISEKLDRDAAHPGGPAHGPGRGDGSR